MRFVGLDVVRRATDTVPIRRRRQLARARVRVRSTVAAARGLPDALVIGAQRCGTSSLYKQLGAHPEVIPSVRKEIEYFSTAFGEGERWYRAHFPLEARLVLNVRRGRRRPLTFEATPDYMLDPRAAERAAALVPEARLVAILRNPADRAFSQYLHNRRLGHEDLSFEDALAAEPERVEREVDRLLADPGYRALPLRRHAYVGRGLYADQLAAWLAWFGPERLLVVVSERMFRDPAGEYRRMTEFLELSDWVPPRFDNHSYAAGGDAGAERLLPATRRHLSEMFQPHNRALAALIGFDPGWDAPSDRSSPSAEESTL